MIFARYFPRCRCVHYTRVSGHGILSCGGLRDALQFLLNRRILLRCLCWRPVMQNWVVSSRGYCKATISLKTGQFTSNCTHTLTSSLTENAWGHLGNHLISVMSCGTSSGIQRFNVSVLGYHIAGLELGLYCYLLSIRWHDSHCLSKCTIWDFQSWVKRFCLISLRRDRWAYFVDIVRFPYAHVRARDRMWVIAFNCFCSLKFLGNEVDLALCHCEFSYFKIPSDFHSCFCFHQALSKNSLYENFREFWRWYLGSRRNFLPFWSQAFWLWHLCWRLCVQGTHEVRTWNKYDSLWIYATSCEGPEASEGNRFCFLINYVTDILRESTPQPV